MEGVVPIEHVRNVLPGLPAIVEVEGEPMLVSSARQNAGAMIRGKHGIAIGSRIRSMARKMRKQAERNG
jgi:hypothetical protein